MYQQKNEFDQAEVKIIAISFETVKSARKYLEDTSLAWPILLDEKKELYHFFNMREAGFWDIWGYRSWLAYGKELLQGRLPRMSGGDINQRGGDVLIDPQGVVRLNHVGEGPGDRPDVDGLLQFILAA